MKVNLGCPFFCEGWLCVDLKPKEQNVVKSDVYEWLRKQPNCSIDEIYSKNLLEHLLNVGYFFQECNRVLKHEGKLTVITDNAEFLLFYLPFWINHTGIGAHANDSYAMSKSHNESHHYQIFTKMHLRNILKATDFKMVHIKRVMLGARLKVEASKI